MINSGATKSSTCICFLCDQKYLFPTLVAAKQASVQTQGLADVIIVLSSSKLSTEQVALYEMLSGAKIQYLPPHVNDLIDENIPPDFFRTHVNRAALYRLFIGNLVQGPYDTIMYMDGDLSIRGSLADALTCDLPAGAVGAVPDWVAHHSTIGMPYVEENQAYMTRLQMEQRHWGHYFNSGVMIASRSTWRDVGKAAFDFLTNNPSACRLHDQSALNYACQGRVKPLPVSYNFLRQYMHLPAYKEINPAIVHFVGKLKPWHGVFKPWTRAEYRPYEELYRQLPTDALVWPKKPLLEKIAYKFKTSLVDGGYGNNAYKARINQLVLDNNAWL